jgi:hypothetical protein
MTEHPITPPPELVVEWADTIYQQTECDDQRDLYVATQSARWGADQELEACCEWVNDDLAYDVADRLRSARRPKPPSLKQRGLNSLTQLEAQGLCPELVSEVRRALEALPDV